MATPEIVRDYIAAIPKGQTRSVKQMREELAKNHRASVTCPTSSGIFVRIVSESALADLQEGKSLKKITPFWRLVDPDSPAAHKISCGPDFILDRLREESE